MPYEAYLGWIGRDEKPAIAHSHSLQDLEKTLEECKVARGLNNGRTDFIIWIEETGKPAHVRDLSDQNHYSLFGVPIQINI